MRTILLTVLLLISSVFPDAGESPSEEDSTGTGLIGLIMELASSEGRSWARPIERVDMDRMLELMEMGFITFHTADWFAVLSNDE
jgi:hypothetical protein